MRAVKDVCKIYEIVVNRLQRRSSASARPLYSKSEDCCSEVEKKPGAFRMKWLELFARATHLLPKNIGDFKIGEIFQYLS